MLRSASDKHCIVEYNDFMSFECDDDYHCSELIKNMNKFDVIEKKCTSNVTVGTYIFVFGEICFILCGVTLAICMMIGLIAILCGVILGAFLEIYCYLYSIFQKCSKKTQNGNYNKVNETRNGINLI